MSESARSEVYRRCTAARGGVASLGGAWGHGVPWRWKRSLFIGFVQNTLLSCLESFVFSKTDTDILDSCLARMGRVVMMGAAADHDGPHVKTLSNKQVLAKLRLVPSETELLIRRLKMYQGWSRSPGDHGQVLCALFGNTEIDRFKPQIIAGRP
eukprot:8978097-Pyramimonas_sp.AAC.1